MRAVECGHLNARTIEYDCTRPAVVVVELDYGERGDGVGKGACRDHIGPVVMWVGEASRGHQPDRAVRCLPVHEWNRLADERAERKGS